MAIKYFLYSPTQLRLRREVEQKMGKRFYVGHVIINGNKKAFTELSSKKTSKFPDAVVVCEMDTEKDHIKYELPEGR